LEKKPQQASMTPFWGKRKKTQQMRGEEGSRQGTFSSRSVGTKGKNKGNLGKKKRPFGRKGSKGFVRNTSSRYSQGGSTSKEKSKTKKGKINSSKASMVAGGAAKRKESEKALTDEKKGRVEFREKKKKAKVAFKKYQGRQRGG